MNITRRDALLGATAAAAVTGLTAVPLAIKAAGVKAVLVGTSDARIVALAEEHDRTLAEMDKTKDRWCDLLTEKLPPHLRHVDLLKSRPVFHLALEVCKDPELKALGAAEDRLVERRREIIAQLSQTEARTLQGVCTKFRVAMRPGHRSGCDLIDSAVADLECLAGEARS